MMQRSGLDPSGLVRETGGRSSLTGARTPAYLQPRPAKLHKGGPKHKALCLQVWVRGQGEELPDSGQPPCGFRAGLIRAPSGSDFASLKERRPPCAPGILLDSF